MRRLTLADEHVQIHKLQWNRVCAWDSFVPNFHVGDFFFVLLCVKYFKLDHINVNKSLEY